MASKREERKAGFRDAMGEYIPPPGGKPLTSLDSCNPGPAAYEMPPLEVNLPASPAYYLVGRPAKDTKKVIDKSKMFYDVKLPRCKNQLLTTLKPRLKPINNDCSPGPVHKVTVGDVAKKPPKTTLKLRLPPGVTTGLPSPLDKPSCADTPAPNSYAAVTSHLPFAGTFAINSRLDHRNRTAGPGPAAVNVRPEPSGPHFSLHYRPKPLKPVMDNPPPWTYDPVLVEPDSHAPKIGERISERPATPIPGPGEYTERKTKCPRGPEMTFRPFETVKETPGPTTYSPEKLTRSAPAYIIAEAEEFEPEITPVGPASYNLSRELREKPAFSFGSKLKPSLNDTPAPNAYNPTEPSGTRRGFSLCPRAPKPKPEKSPAPNAYMATKLLPKAPTFAFGIKHRDMGDRELTMVPSPAHYFPGPSCGCTAHARTKPGASLKGRASKFAYSGFDASRNFGRMSERAERTRPVIA